MLLCHHAGNVTAALITANLRVLAPSTEDDGQVSVEVKFLNLLLPIVGGGVEQGRRQRPIGSRADSPALAFTTGVQCGIRSGEFLINILTQGTFPGLRFGEETNIALSSYKTWKGSKALASPC
ncbi:hypothetical protein A7E78_00830 [Syntrophotalea acetylenivorans]|uniref:Uncharacterized protein n=1 Tax=Syntrophotalea acetylenivorans TaxID=1842532 RepID=A0A1L3GKT1_9BACT|nr:hypothetical protein A7E78_00830 [Syntrophotalea acetylenivorans]